MDTGLRALCWAVALAEAPAHGIAVQIMVGVVALAEVAPATHGKLNFNL